MTWAEAPRLIPCEQRGVLSLPVELVHGGLGALHRPANGGLGGAFVGGIQLDALVAARGAEQEVYVLVAAVQRAAHANLDAREAVGPQVLDGGFKAVLAARGAVRAQ